MSREVELQQEPEVCDISELGEGVFDHHDIRCIEHTEIEGYKRDVVTWFGGEVYFDQRLYRQHRLRKMGNDILDRCREEKANMDNNRFSKFLIKLKKTIEHQISKTY